MLQDWAFSFQFKSIWRHFIFPHHEAFCWREPLPFRHHSPYNPLMLVAAVRRPNANSSHKPPLAVSWRLLAGDSRLSAGYIQCLARVGAAPLAGLLVGPTVYSPCIEEMLKNGFGVSRAGLGAEIGGYSSQNDRHGIVAATAAGRKRWHSTPYGSQCGRRDLPVKGWGRSAGFVMF